MQVKTERQNRQALLGRAVARRTSKLLEGQKMSLWSAIESAPSNNFQTWFVGGVKQVVLQVLQEEGYNNIWEAERKLQPHEFNGLVFQAYGRM